MWWTTEPEAASQIQRGRAAQSLNTALDSFSLFFNRCASECGTGYRFGRLWGRHCISDLIFIGRTRLTLALSAGARYRMGLSQTGPLLLVHQTVGWYGRPTVVIRKRWQIPRWFNWSWIGYQPLAIDWHRDLWLWMTLNRPRSKLLTLHYIVTVVMPYVATCCLVLWCMGWNGNSIGQIHVS